MAFATLNSTAPLSVAGTGFLVGHGRRICLVSAGHVVGDLEYSRIVVYPTDGTSVPLKLQAGWQFSEDHGSTDGSDIFIGRTGMADFPRGIKKRSRLLNIEAPEMSEWYATRYTSMFFAAGYPDSDTYVDYASLQLKYRPFLLHGNYSGPGSEPGCHRLKLRNPLNLQTFNGLSGSPVFSIPHSIGLASTPKFCGMLIRGTASSGIVHFVEASAILTALEETRRVA